MSLADRDYDARNSLPELKVGRWLRIKMWRKHRKLHAQLKYQLLSFGDERNTLMCVHCGRTWQLFGSSQARWLVELPRR